MLQEITDHLKNDIIPFWEKLRDDEYGGYYGYMGYDLAVDRKYSKGCILNSRILWFFSNAYMTLHEKTLLSYADHAYEFMKQHCLDRVNGGILWSCTYDGKPDDTTKHTYNQAFAIYALSSYYDATKSREPLDEAYRLFDCIETHCRDEGGYLEAFDISWKPASNEKLSENGVMATRTMNTLLHVFEAYTELYRVTKDPKVAIKLEWILDTFADKMYNPVLRRQEVFFDHEYNSLIDLHSYGHDIETSWLIDRGLHILDNKRLSEKLAPITDALAENVYEKAFHKGSLYAECENGVDKKNRVWWVQAETLLGFMNAAAKHPEEQKYVKAAEEVCHFILNSLVDKRNGSEWFWELDDDLRPIPDRPIVEPWKCPYHNGRMCMEIIRRLG